MLLKPKLRRDTMISCFLIGVSLININISGLPKTETPTYRTVRRIVILPLSTKYSTESKNPDLTQTNEIVQKTRHSDIHSSKTGYLIKAEPQTKPFKDTNSVKHKTFISDSKNGGTQQSNSEKAKISLSVTPTQASLRTQSNQHKRPQSSTLSHPSTTNHMKIGKASLHNRRNYNSHTKASHHTGRVLSVTPSQQDKMKDSTSFVKFAFSLNSPASIFLNNVESPPTKIEPIRAGYSGAISAPLNTFVQADSKKDKTGPGLSATPYIGSQKTSNSGVVFEEIDPLSLTNFILAAGDGLNEGKAEIEMSQAPIRLPDNTLKSGVILEIPEKNDFIGQNTQRAKKNDATPISQKHQENTIHKENVRNLPATDKMSTMDKTDARPSTKFRLSQTKQTPFSFSLSGLSVGSHTRSPKTTIPHSVKPTIKPTLKTPIIHKSPNTLSGHLSTTYHVQKQDSHHHHVKENRISKHQHHQNVQTHQNDMKSNVASNTYQYINNSRIQYQTTNNSPLKSPHKMHTDNKAPNTHSRDYVQQGSTLLSSFKPMKNVPVNNMVNQNFEVNDKFTPYSSTVQTGHSSDVHTAKTTPKIRIVEQKPTTPSWQSNHHTYSHQKVGKIGHYHKEPVIEIQGNSVSQSKHMNQIYSSNLSGVHKDHLMSHPGTQTTSTNMENTINGFPASQTKGSTKTNESVGSPNQWSTSELSASNTLFSGSPNPKKMSDKSGSAVLAQNMHQSTINEIPNQTKPNIVHSSLHAIGTQHHDKLQSVKNTPQQASQNQHQPEHQNRLETSHAGPGVQTRSKQGQSALPEMTQGIPAPRSPRLNTSTQAELKTPGTTKIPVFSKGTDNYAISPQLLSLLRQLPVGDLSNFEKRRLERILGVGNGQLDAKETDPVSAIENVIHEKKIQTGKASRFEVSPKGLASSKARYVAPSYLLENANTRKSLGDFFTAERATN